MSDRVLVINLQQFWTECTVCGADTPARWGLPCWNGFIVANDWPGEWGGVPTCESCWERHERGELVEVPTSEYATLVIDRGREMSVRVLITGDRNWNCRDLAQRVVARLVARHGAVTVVQGAASGVDQAFVEAAFEAGCEVSSFAAEWDTHGPKAGPLRNQEMVDAGADFAIAVHRNLAWSRGTKDAVRRCLKAGIPVWLIDGEDAEPKRIEKLQ